MAGPVGAVYRELLSVMPDRALLPRARLDELGMTATPGLVLDVAVLDKDDALELAILIDPVPERLQAIREAVGGVRLLTLPGGQDEEALLGALHEELALLAAPPVRADAAHLHAAELQGWGRELPRTGLTELDRRLGPLEGGDLVVVGGVTGVGKSSFIRHLAIENAVQRGMPTLYLSLEASATRAAMDVVASSTNISSQRMAAGSLTAEEEGRVRGMAKKLHESPLTIVARADVTLRHLEGLVRATGSGSPVRMVVVDYLELLSGADGLEALAHLKRLARRHDLPIVAATNSLHSGTTKRSDGRPTLVDLGDMGLHSDKVLLMHREEVYDLRRDNAYVMEVTIAKNRGGPKVMVQIAFREESRSFNDLEIAYDEELQGP